MPTAALSLHLTFAHVLGVHIFCSPYWGFYFVHFSPEQHVKMSLSKTEVSHFWTISCGPVSFNLCLNDKLE